MYLNLVDNHVIKKIDHPFYMPNTTEYKKIPDHLDG